MRPAVLALALLASAASAQAPDSTAAPVGPQGVRSADTLAVRLPPLAVHSGASALGYVAGGVMGYYVGDALNGDGFILSDGGVTGLLVGTTLGAALVARGVGDPRGFWRALGGAAAGQLVGFAVVSLLDDSPLGESVVFALPIAAGVGAALGNRYGVEPRARVPAPGGR